MVQRVNVCVCACVHAPSRILKRGNADSTPSRPVASNRFLIDSPSVAVSPDACTLNRCQRALPARLGQPWEERSRGWLLLGLRTYLSLLVEVQPTAERFPIADSGGTLTRLLLLPGCREPQQGRRLGLGAPGRSGIGHISNEIRLALTVDLGNVWSIYGAPPGTASCTVWRGEAGGRAELQ